MARNDFKIELDVFLSDFAYMHAHARVRAFIRLFINNNIIIII